MPQWHLSKPRIPVRAVILSIAALAVPFVDTLFWAGDSQPGSPLLWLLALVPAFLLAYYRGWRGVATALAAGMALLTLAICILLARGAEFSADDILFQVVAAYVAISLATGWLSELMHASRIRAELLALTDDLTGLPNRRHARLFLENQVQRAHGGEPMSVVLFDLDSFKAFNDRHGHPAGDAVLCTFARVMSEAAQAHDMAARYGGEEFLAILSGCDEADALSFAEHVRSALQSAQQTHVPVTVSAGVACFGPDITSANDLIIAADRALYRAKREGRNRACLGTQLIAAG